VAQPRGIATADEVIDIWDDTGDSIVEHVAGVDDFEVAEATYRAAVARWPAARITLRAGCASNRGQAGACAWCRVNKSAAGTDVVGAYQQCVAQRMQMAAEDGRRLYDDCQKITQTITRSLSNGWPAAST
jgi:hypothetical protein